MPQKNPDYIFTRCFYDTNHVIKVGREVFEDNGEGFIRQEYKGKIWEGEGSRVYIGVVGIFCFECHDAFCGPRPKKTMDDEINELEEKLKERDN